MGLDIDLKNNIVQFLFEETENTIEVENCFRILMKGNLIEIKKCTYNDYLSVAFSLFIFQNNMNDKDFHELFLSDESNNEIRILLKK